MAGIDTTGIVRMRCQVTCGVPGCSRKYFQDGMCASHWRRVQDGRGLDAPIRVSRPWSTPKDTWFWQQVTIGTPSECWLYQGAKDQNDYGKHRWGKRKLGAHRIAWALANGIDPDDLQHGHVIRHSCDNPPCCNPSHLERGSQSDNCIDRVSKLRFTALTEAEIVDILVRARGGETVQSIADSYGRSKRNTMKVIKGQAYTAVRPDIPRRFGNRWNGEWKCLPSAA